MKAKNLSNAFLVGTARMLTIASGFLLRITEQNVPENHSNPLADREGSAPKDYESDPTKKWPEVWAQRISAANNVTWFSFDVNKGMNIQYPKPIHTLDNRTKNTERPNPQRIVADPLKEVQLEGKRKPSDMEKKVTSVEADNPSHSAETPRVFDSKKRFWVYKDHENPKPQKPEKVNPVVRVPEKTGPGVEYHKTSEPFGQNRVQPTRVTLKNEDLLDMSMAEELMTEKTLGDIRPAQTPVRTWPQDDYILRDFREIPSGISRQQEPMPLRPEPVRNNDDVTRDRLSVENEPPFSGKWPDFINTDTPSSESTRPHVSSFIEETGKTHTGRKSILRNEPSPEAEKHWPELENFAAHPELMTMEKDPENHDRILRLKQEQKGSLWSVLRF